MPGVFTPSEVHLDETLTNLTIAHMQSAENFVAPAVFPNVPVQYQSDRYYVWDRDFYNRVNEVEKAAPRTESPEITLPVSTDTYAIDLFHLGASFSEQMLANEDTALNTRATAAATLANRGMLKREKDFISTFFGPGIWTTEYTGVANTPSAVQFIHWDDYVNSTPIVDVRRARTAMHLASSGVAFGNQTVALMTRDVYDTLMEHPDFISRINGGATTGQPAKVNRALLAAMFEVDEVQVFDAVQNTAAEGAARSESFVTTNGFALISRPPSPGLEVASAGYTFTWNGLPNNSGLGTSILSYSGHDDLARKKIAEKIEIYMGWDMKVTSPDLGVWFGSVLA
jgi:hypothetical protein